MATRSIKLWAIIDTSKKKPRFCYASPNKSKGAMALYDKKPTIQKKWKSIKKVRRVTVVLP